MTLQKLFILGLIIITSTSVFASDPTGFVINTTGETLSKIDLIDNSVTNNILILGSDINCYPNQIIVRDTLAYVVMSGTSEIQIININTETTVGWIYMPPGSNPYWMAFLDDQFLYVTLMLDNTLAKVDVHTRQVVRLTPIGTSPEGILIYDNKAYVAVTAFDFSTYTWGQGEVAVYDTEGDTILTTIEVGKNPQYLDFDRRGKIHVACTGDYFSIPGAIYIIDALSDSVVDSINIGGQPGQVVVTPGDVSYLAAGGWVDDGEVYSYDAANYDVYHDWQNPLTVDSGAMAVAAFHDSTLFVMTFGDRIFRIDGDGATINSYILGDGPISLDFNYLPGDANGDFQVNLGDASFLINMIFYDGAAPARPAWRANPNGDNAINLGDAAYLINYIFSDGLRPQTGPTWVH